MEKQVKFSLSYYFDELKRQKNGNTRNESSEIMEQRIQSERVIRAPATATISVLRALKEAEGYTLTFMALAKSARLKLDICQEALAQLSSEELVEIEPDFDTGNDRVRLTRKGADLV
ncbi:hypothetical protein [Desulfonema magnum]|nr:hypothetical protein [Desulfonema magnum]